MKRQELFRWAVLSLGLVVATPSASAGKPVIINVSTTADLYNAVKPANAGATVLLASGTYTLDTSRPNGGRLVLPPGMNLVGVERRRGRESKIVVPELPNAAGNPGAIRIGDHNAVRWITVEAEVFAPSLPMGSTPAVGACIDIGILPATAGAGMTAEVSDCRLIGATRGIRCQHMGAAAAGRHSVILLERNETLRQGDGNRFGIQVQNGSGADGASFEVTLLDNVCTETKIGLYVVNVGCDGSTNEVHSERNVYSGNESGIVLHAGRDLTPGAMIGSTACSLEFASIDDSIHDNTGGSVLMTTGGGGITAIGGLRTSDLASASANNRLDLTLRGTSFARNEADGLARDLTVFGGLGIETLPGGGNDAQVRLEEVDAAGDDTFAFVCSYPGQPTDEPENIVEARIDGEGVEVDCD